MDVVTLGAARQYAAQRASRGGNTVVAMGDSITAGGVVASENIQSDTWITRMVYASQGRMRLVRNSGIGGNTSLNMLNRFQTDVLAYKPSVVLITSGTNDLDWTAGTLACTEQMIKLCLANNIRVALLTLPPRGGPTLIGPTGVTATALTDSGTLAAGTYDYVISAGTGGAAGSGGGLSLPSSPVTVTVATPGRVRLTWTPVASGQHRFYRRTSGVGNYEFIGGIGANYGRDNSPYFYDPGLSQSVGTNPAAADVPNSGNYSGAYLDSTQRTKTINALHVYQLLATKYGIPMVNQYDLMVDPATGMYKAQKVLDGIHPLPGAQKEMGDNAWATLAHMFPPSPTYLTQDFYDTQDMFGGAQDFAHSNQSTNAGLLPTTQATPTSQLPAGWSSYGSSGVTVDVRPKAGAVGNVITLTSTDYGGQRFLDKGTSTGFSVGDRIKFAIKFRATGVTASAGSATFGVRFYGNTVSPGYLTLNKLDSDVTDWTVWTSEAVVPAGTNGIGYTSNVAGYNVALEIAQLTLVNMTTRGLA